MNGAPDIMFQWIWFRMDFGNDAKRITWSIGSECEALKGPRDTYQKPNMLSFYSDVAC